MQLTFPYLAEHEEVLLRTKLGHPFRRRQIDKFVQGFASIQRYYSLFADNGGIAVLWTAAGFTNLSLSSLQNSDFSRIAVGKQYAGFIFFTEILVISGREIRVTQYLHHTPVAEIDCWPDK